MVDSKNVIVTGGAGYIGSHTCKELSHRGFTPIVLDDLSTGHEVAVQWGELEQANVLDQERVAEIMQQYKPVAVINFAAKSLVGESMDAPTMYWENNVGGAVSLLKGMRAAGVKHIVSSSTAAVYGEPDVAGALTEDLPLNPINPYGRSKLAVERLLFDAEAEGITAVLPRYFNAAGADKEGEIGEMHATETHLIPLVIQTAIGEREKISIFGTDYNTEDGTCVRDYIHVEDLARAHVDAVEYLIAGGETTAVNLGTGNGFSVRQIINTAREVSGLPIDAVEADRRAGDPSSLVANPDKAETVLGWKAKYGLAEIMKDAVRFHQGSVYQNFVNRKHNQPAPKV